MGTIPRRELVGKRYAAGSKVKGRWVEGADSPLDFRASVQPISPETMASVPENRRETARYELYTDFRCKTVDKVAGTNADRVTIDGEEFEVFAVGVWQNKILPHYQVLVASIKDL